MRINWGKILSRKVVSRNRELHWRRLPKRVAAYQARMESPGFWGKVTSPPVVSSPQNHLAHPPPHDLSAVPFPTPFSFSTGLLFTEEALKFRPRPMNVPICTALEGWGAMDSFGTIDHLRAPACPLSARAGWL